MDDDQLGDMKSLIRKDALAKIFTVLLLILIFNASTGFMENVISENFELSVTIERIDINGLKVHLEGRAQGINFPGQLNHYQVQVDWGDGNTDLNSACNFTLKDLDNDGREDDFEGSWFSDPDHTYATYGNYTIKVKLYHQNPPGAESFESNPEQITIQLVYADLSITKSGPLYAHVGDAITYTFNITNLGQYDAENVTVKDSLLGEIYGPEDLAAYTFKLFTIEYHVKDDDPDDDPDKLINIASITSDTYDPNEENNEASWAVTILRPAIAIKKSADKTDAHVGDVITYIYNITNPGNEPLKNITVVDSLGMTGSYVSGDIDNDGWLDPDEFWIFSATYNVTDDDPDPLKNTATVSGSCEHNRTVTATTQLEVRKIRQYNITFDQQGLDSTIDGSSALLTVNGTDIYELPFSMLVDEGEIIVFSYSTDISSTVEGKRFILKSVNASSPLIADGSKLIIGEYKSQYQLTLSVHPLEAGDLSTSPLSPDGYYDAGINVSIIATPSNGYAFSHWELDGSNAGSSSPINVTMDAPHNLTAYFSSSAPSTATVTFSVSEMGSDASDIILTIDNVSYAYADLPKSFTWTVGSLHSFEWKDPIASTTSGKRYAWVLTSGLSTAKSESIAVPSGGGSVAATYKAQYQWIFSASGLSSDASGTVITVDGTNYGYSSLPLTFWWDDGSSHSYSYQQYVSTSDSGKRYANHNPPSETITVSSSGSLNPPYRTEYQLTTSVSPSGAGSISLSPSSSDGYYDGGTNVTATASASTSYTFGKWQLDSVDYSTNNPVSLTMDAPHTLVAYFTSSTPPPSFDFSVSVSPSIISVGRSGSATATVTVTLVSGSSTTVSLSTSGQPSGVTVSFSPSSGNPTFTSTMTISVSNSAPTGTYTITIMGTDGGISRSTTLTLNIFDFSVSVSPSSGSTAQGGSVSATVTVSAVSGSAGLPTVALSASGLPSGASASFSPSSGTPTFSSIMTITTSSTTPTGTYTISITSSGGGITRTAAYTLTVNPATATVTFSVSGMSSDASGAVLTVDGVSYAYADLPKSFTWDVGSSHSFSWSDPVSAGSGKRYAWVSTNGLSTAKSGAITVPAEGGLVNATYKTQYYLTVISLYDASGGEGWYDANDEAYASLATGAVNLTSGMRAVFVGWSGDASGNNLISDPIVMNAPKTAVANWVIQWFINVKVTPEEAGSIPGGGWYENCTTITFEAPEYLPSGEGTSDVRYRFDYWEVDGERFESNIISVHANTSHTITSHYVIQYRVIFNQKGLDQSVNEAILTVNGSAKKLESLPLIMWVDYGSLINYVYKENVSSSVSGKQFRIEDIIGPSSPLRVTEPANVTGNYQTLYYLSVVSQYGDPYGSGWYPFNSEAKFGVTTPVDHGNRTLRVFLKWHGDVSIFEPKGAILMIKPSAVVASWETQYLLTFNTTLPNKYVLRVPGVPEILPPGMDVFGMYYPVGERVEVGPAPTIVPGSEGIRYTFAGWILDGELFTHNVNMSFVVKKPHDVAVLYDTEYLLSVNAVGVSDPFISAITISSGSSLMRELTPYSSIQEWFKQGANLALTASTPNKIGHGEWAIFKEWTGHLQAVNRTISLTMLSPMNLNVVFFKVNPVAESIPYSIIAGLISMLLCAVSARRRSSNSSNGKKKRRSAASGIIVSAVALLVAAIVSIIVATRYGININELPDFTNWAVIFLLIEAVIFALTTTIVVRKLQRQKEQS